MSDTGPPNAAPAVLALELSWACTELVTPTRVLSSVEVVIPVRRFLTPSDTTTLLALNPVYASGRPVSLMAPVNIAPAVLALAFSWSCTLLETPVRLSSSAVVTLEVSAAMDALLTSTRLGVANTGIPPPAELSWAWMLPVMPTRVSSCWIVTLELTRVLDPSNTAALPAVWEVSDTGPEKAAPAMLALAFSWACTFPVVPPR